MPIANSCVYASSECTYLQGITFDSVSDFDSSNSKMINVDINIFIDYDCEKFPFLILRTFKIKFFKNKAYNIIFTTY